MRIGKEPPFEIHPEPDGTVHAIREDIQITVLPDVGDFKIFHRVGTKPATGEESRWGVIDLKEKGVKIFLHATHVVVTTRDLNPTFSEKEAADATI